MHTYTRTCKGNSYTVRRRSRRALRLGIFMSFIRNWSIGDSAALSPCSNQDVTKLNKAVAQRNAMQCKQYNRIWKNKIQKPIDRVSCNTMQPLRDDTTQQHSATQ